MTILGPPGGPSSQLIAGIVLYVYVQGTLALSSGCAEVGCSV